VTLNWYFYDYHDLRKTNTMLFWYVFIFMWILNLLLWLSTNYYFSFLFFVLFLLCWNILELILPHVLFVTFNQCFFATYISVELQVMLLWYTFKWVLIVILWLFVNYCFFFVKTKIYLWVVNLNYLDPSITLPELTSHRYSHKSQVYIKIKKDHTPTRLW
jgi:hypothetical protein